MTDTPFTTRNVAKFVAKAIVAAKAKQTAETAITEYTELEKDDTIVDISGSVIGWYVSEKLSPVTDKMVDKTADFIAAKREARKAKKDNPSEQ
jgi:hypothetical protein